MFIKLGSADPCTQLTTNYTIHATTTCNTHIQQCCNVLHEDCALKNIWQIFRGIHSGREQ